MPVVKVAGDRYAGSGRRVAEEGHVTDGFLKLIARAGWRGIGFQQCCEPVFPESNLIRD
jgi:hypothetical protein